LHGIFTGIRGDLSLKECDMPLVKRKIKDIDPPPPKIWFYSWMSVCWLIFTLLYLWDRLDYFYFLAYIQKFVAMGVLPLIIVWGIWGIIQVFKKDKA